MKKNIIVIFIVIFILTIIASFLGAKIYEYKQKKEDNSLTEQEREDRDYENTIINKITDMSEIQRIQTYFGKFLKYIEDARYDKAYELLNDKFKYKYFENVEKFTEYVQNKYPRKNIATEYTDVEIYGDVFVLTVNISEVFNKQFESFEQRIVIRENSANDFKVSFQVEPDGDTSQIGQSGEIED